MDSVTTAANAAKQAARQHPLQARRRLLARRNQSLSCVSVSNPVLLLGPEGMRVVLERSSVLRLLRTPRQPLVVAA